ncbi:hypothetical protein [Paenisporosarcina quisquiliarum]|uniref:hypothetical protein n=1 Tax=Paenisporosarcina quisquiliarum TaxID=365346 RepID=UPI00373632D2
MDRGIQGFIGYIQGFELPILKFTFSTQFQRAENGAFLLLFYLYWMKIKYEYLYIQRKGLISIAVDAFRGQDFSRFPRIRSVQGLQFLLIPLESPPPFQSTDTAKSLITIEKLTHTGL